MSYKIWGSGSKDKGNFIVNKIFHCDSRRCQPCNVILNFSIGGILFRELELRFGSKVIDKQNCHTVTVIEGVTELPF